MQKLLQRYSNVNEVLPPNRHSMHYARLVSHNVGSPFLCLVLIGMLCIFCRSSTRRNPERYVVDDDRLVSRN